MRARVSTRPAVPLCGALLLLEACAFPDRVSVGKDGVPETRGATAGGGSAGAGGSTIANSAGSAGGPSDVGPHIDPSEPVGSCSMGVQVGHDWIQSQQSPVDMGSGSGGQLKMGTYYLSGLVLHGDCPCFDTSIALVQTVSVGEDRGQVVSQDETGRYWASRFAYTVEGRFINVVATCGQSQPDDALSVSGPFGPFDTYTATPDRLVLFSSTCNYRAEYWLAAIPTR